MIRQGVDTSNFSLLAKHNIDRAIVVNESLAAADFVDGMNNSSQIFLFFFSWYNVRSCVVGV